MGGGPHLLRHGWPRVEDAHDGPTLRAVPMAESPATPPPMTSILAGGTRPAAVICPVRKRPKYLAASMTALHAVQGSCSRGHW